MNPEIERYLREKKSEGNYVIYLNTYVMVHTQSKTAIRKMIFTDFETTLLCPSLINESIEQHRECRIETKFPSTIDTSAIKIIEPTSVNYLEKIVDYYEKHPEEETKK